MSYLDTHKPARSQFREGRRAPAWHPGPIVTAFVAHTPEAGTDLDGADTKAEAVAAFIAGRTDAAGSYHEVIDSDSSVDVVRSECEAYGEGTGGNRWAIHLSAATNAAEWPNLPAAWIDGLVDQFAQAAARRNAWVAKTYGYSIPPKRITADEYRLGVRGWIEHGELDPGRRSDPGAGFPWDRILRRYAALTGQRYNGVLIGQDDGPVATWQQHLVDQGHDLGRTGPAGNGVDGDFGPGTLRESLRRDQWQTDHAAELAEISRGRADEITALTAEIDRLRADNEAKFYAITDLSARFVKLEADLVAAEGPAVTAITTSLTTAVFVPLAPLAAAILHQLARAGADGAAAANDPVARRALVVAGAQLDAALQTIGTTVAAQLGDRIDTGSAQ